MQHPPSFKEAAGLHQENLFLLEWDLRGFGNEGSTEGTGTRQQQVQILFAFCCTRKRIEYFLAKETSIYTVYQCSERTGGNCRSKSTHLNSWQEKQA